MKKILTLIIILMFVGIMINPSSGEILSLDDTTPPVSTHSLYPLEPDGENGYYVSNVTVTLNATDNESGVDRIEYRIDGGSWKIIPGDNGTFVISQDGNDMNIEYRAVDNVGNVESTNSFTIDMDQTPPVAEEITWEAYKMDGIWYIDFTASAVDVTSGMDRVECIIEAGYNVTIVGAGPYGFTMQWSDAFRNRILWVFAYDKAGNVANTSLNLSDIESYPDRQSKPIFFPKWLERFPLLNQIINLIMERWNL
jgi:hypothetical protein